MNSFSLKNSISNALYFIGSMLVLIGLWQLVTILTKNEIPGPVTTWQVFMELMSEPFYDREFQR
jgi:nitrate/nitrite transport system permease protein